MRSRVLSSLRNLLRRDRRDRELDEELRSFVEMVTENKCNAGLTHEEARRAALLELGGLDQVKEQVRAVRTGAGMEPIVQDVVYGSRMLIRHSGFTASAVATLALGIGANTAIFSVVDTIVFRPLPYEEPDRLVKVCTPDPGTQQCSDDMSMLDFLDIRDQSRTFEQLAADDGEGFDLTHDDGRRETVNGALVTANWLSTIGSRPILGRDFAPAEQRPGRDQVAILSHEYWQRRFGSTPKIVGRTLIVDGDPLTVIGVLPPNVLRYGADLLRPLVLANYPAGREHRDLDVFGRLERGVTLNQARAEVETIAARLAQRYAATNKGRTVRLVPLDKYYAGIDSSADRGLLLMLGAVGLVLLIACANVANLLLARAITRRRECGIRAVLGATRVRLVRQLLVETVLLFLMGGAVGLLMARWSVDFLLAFAIAGGYVPERMVVSVDGRVLAFGLLISLLAGAAFGLFPAVQASRVDINEGLRDSNQALGTGRRHNRARRLLIVSEVALSLVLLVGFGLMTRTFLRIYTVSGGFDPENLVQTSSDGGRSFPEAVAFWRTALERARAIPGVAHAAVTSRPPLHGARGQRFVVDDRPSVAEGEEPTAGDILISSDYFQTMHIPLVKGRAFTEQDDGLAPPVVIISQSLARRYFPNQDPLGRRVTLKERSPMSCCSAAKPVERVWWEIVGVVGDVRQANLEEEPAVTLYRPYSQIVEHDMFLMVRAGSAPEVALVAAQIRSHLVAADPNRVWSDVRPMQQVIHESESIRSRHFVLILLGGFAIVALVLAAIGIYGVTACSVAERTREIGVRMALGATRQVVFTQVLRETMMLAVVGLAVGAVAALALTRFIASMLFETSPTDALTYLGVSFLLATFALLAAYVPARRATQVDPIAALRYQ